MKIIKTLFLIATIACLTSVSAQNNPEPAKTPSVSACPTAQEMEQQHLQGVWRAELTGSAASTEAVLLRLGQHPEMAGSVRGTAQRGSTTSQVAGDVHQGDLALEESSDGKRISATWIGAVVDGSCGQEMRGTWHRVDPETSLPFVLRKQTAAHSFSPLLAAPPP